MKKWLKRAIPLVLTASLLAGCSFGGDKEGKDKEQATLRVMYYDESSFFQEYGMLFSALYPEVDIQVVSTGNLYRGNNEGEEFDYEKAKQEFIEKEKPDLLMMDLNEYTKMAEEGKLYDLEALMTKDKFKTEGIVPGMIDHMKELGGGQLYAMPSAVSSEVLFYNKELFDKFSIPYPTDQMSWAEVIQLARQFPTEGTPEDRIYGLKAGYSGNLNQFSTMLAQSEGLSYVNPETKQMTINTPGWANSIKTALDALKSDALYFEDQSNPMSMSYSQDDFYLRNPFTSGRVAMSISSSYYIREIEDAKQYVKDEGSVVKEWDIVTVPVSTQFPNESSMAWYSSIFGIAKDSPNADAAWKFISYIASEDYARVKSKMANYNGMPIHTKYIKDDEGHNFAAFYKLKPSKNNQYADYSKLPPAFGSFYNIMEEELKSVQDGKKEVEEALEYLQVKGEELLAQEPAPEKEAIKTEGNEQKIEEAAGETSSETSSVEASSAPEVVE